jgi:hypothetical protein
LFGGDPVGDEVDGIPDCPDALEFLVWDLQ